jgi:hypothetical protein
VYIYPWYSIDLIRPLNPPVKMAYERLVSDADDVLHYLGIEVKAQHVVRSTCYPSEIPFTRAFYFSVHILATVQNIVLMQEDVASDIRMYLENHFSSFLSAVDSAVSRNPHDKRSIDNLQGDRSRGRKIKNLQTIPQLKLSVLCALDEMAVTGANMTIMLLSRVVRLSRAKKTSALAPRKPTFKRAQSPPRTIRSDQSTRGKMLCAAEVVQVVQQMKAIYEEALASCKDALTLALSDVEMAT